MSDNNFRVPLSLSPSSLRNFRARDAHGAVIADAEMDALERALQATESQVTQLRNLQQALTADHSRPAVVRAVELRTAAQRVGERGAAALDPAIARGRRVVDELGSALHGPGLPTGPGAVALESEIRARLAELVPAERSKAVEDAIERLRGDPVAAAVLRAPAFVSGLTAAQLEAHRLRWQTLYEPERLDRRVRLHKAVIAAERGGAALVALVKGIVTNPAAAGAATAAEAAIAAGSELGA